MPARAEIESLLRARKLDVTLTSAAPLTHGVRAVAPTGMPALDTALGGGLPRGHLSEIVEPEEERRFREVEHQPALRHLLHPRADRGGERAEPEDAKIPVGERREGALQQRMPQPRRRVGIRLRPRLNLRIERGGQEDLS